MLVSLPGKDRMDGIERLDSTPLAPAIGAEVRGIDLREPLDERRFRDIERLWLERCVLLFRGQDLSVEHQVAFAGRFGPLGRRANVTPGATEHPAVMLVSNIREDGKPIGALPDGEMFFHSDQCYVERPCKATMLYAIEVPSIGGNTIFANTIRAYETLPEELKRRIGELRALNVYDYEGSATRRSDRVAADAPRFVHPVVRTHPETGRRALYVNRLMTQRIEGLDRAESGALLARLFEHQERAEFRYEHRWRSGDLILWDNRSTVHARTDFSAGERRLLRRVILLGDRPV